MYQVAIVGAGPIGIELAIALKRANVSYIQIEAGEIANTIAHYPEQTPFFSSPKRLEIAGYPLEVYPNLKSTKEQYLSYIRGVVSAENLEFSLFSKVESISKNEKDGVFNLGISKLHTAPNFTVSTEPKNQKIDVEVQAKNIVLAIGDMHAPNKLGIPVEDLPIVSHGFDKLHSFFGLKVLIVGGRNSAVEAALRLARIGAQVTLCHRQADVNTEKVKPWLLPDFRGLIREGKIKFLGDSKLIKIDFCSVTISQKEESKQIPIDRVLLLTGYTQSNDLFSQLGLKQVVKESGNRKTDFNPDTMEAAPGVFIIGTAVAGTQISETTEYIETSHIHIPRVLKALNVECKIPILDSPLRPLEEREV
jgi:thioredoxin reductase (NADPH)